jgi:hypothetical protein
MSRSERPATNQEDTMTDSITPISEMAGIAADRRVTLAQIGQGNLMACGARDIVYDDKNGMVMFRVGGGRTLRKVIVKLTPADTYSVERGHLNRNTYEWVVDEQEHDVYAEQLGATVRRLGDR